MLLVLLLLKITLLQPANALCGRPEIVSPPKICDGPQGCTSASVDCKWFTRMPYPSAADAGSSPTYATDTFARWDDLMPEPGSAKGAEPGEYDWTIKTRLKISPLTDNRSWPLLLNSQTDYFYAQDITGGTSDGATLPMLGNIDYSVVYELDGGTAIEATSGSTVMQYSGAAEYTGEDLIGGGRLAHGLKGNPKEIVVKFEATFLDKNSGLYQFNEFLSNPSRIRGPSTHKTIIIQDADSADVIVPSVHITGVKELTTYTWTDLGTEIPTGDFAMGGNCTRGFGSARFTITCVKEGLPEYIMLVGDANVVFDNLTSVSIKTKTKHGTGSNDNVRDAAIFKSINEDGCSGPCGAACQMMRKNCTTDGYCYWDELINSPMKCTQNPAPVIKSVTRFTNAKDLYTVCGLTSRIEGTLFINDLLPNTKGFYLGGCSGSGVTNLDSRMWTMSNGENSLLATLILDDTSLVIPPDISMLGKLERLSISGDLHYGKLTDLPNISALTRLKYFNVSRQPGITTIPAGYFDNNALLEEVVLADNDIQSLPSNIFKFNLNLKVINLRGNKLSVDSLQKSHHNDRLFSHLTKLTHFDISNNDIVVDEAQPLPTDLFAYNENIEQILLDNNNISFLSAQQFHKNRVLNKLGMGGPHNLFRKSSTCPPNYYVTRVFLPSIESGQAVYYGCDYCESASFGNGAYSCWTNFVDWETHHPPVLCPRGSYCDNITKTEIPCPRGKFNPLEGQNSASSCLNCLDGYYNPMGGQQTCPFQCPPGRFGKHSTPPSGGLAIVADSRDKCKECPLGTFCSGQGTVDPIDCPKGKYGKQSAPNEQRENENDRCEPCPHNTYSGETGVTQINGCKNCPAGFYSEVGSSTSQACTENAVAPCAHGEGRSRDANCKACPYGQFALDRLVCRMCPQGWYGPIERSNECTPCSNSNNLDAMSLCGFVPGSSSRADDVEKPAWLYAHNTQTSNTTNARKCEIPVENSDIEYAQIVNNNKDTLKLVLNPILACISIAIIFSHRWCSKRWCHVDLFSSSHMIQDTHAVRKVKSRLGGAFTWALLLATVAIVVQSISERGFQTIMSDTAERVSQFEYLRLQAIESGEKGFGLLRLHLDIFAPLSDMQTMEEKCAAAELIRPSRAARLMECQVERRAADSATCSVSLECQTSFDMRGDVVLQLSLPIEFQAMTWELGVRTWEYFESGNSFEGDNCGYSAKSSLKQWTRFQTTIADTFVPPKGNYVLSGTSTKPTQASFDLTRGFADGSQVSRQATSSGLQLGFKQSTIKSSSVASYNPESSHVVEFYFEVLATLHVETTSEILSGIQLAATIFSLIASATKILKLIKKCAAKAIDTHFVKRSEVLPPDVKRRAELLNEDNLMHTRFQKMMSKHSILGDIATSSLKKAKKTSFATKTSSRVSSDTSVSLEMVPLTVHDVLDDQADCLTESEEELQGESSSKSSVFFFRLDFLEKRNAMLEERMKQLEQTFSLVPSTQDSDTIEKSNVENHDCTEHITPMEGDGNTKQTAAEGGSGSGGSE